jgi:hypothetical protein
MQVLNYEAYIYMKVSDTRSYRVKKITIRDKTVDEDLFPELDLSGSFYARDGLVVETNHFYWDEGEDPEIIITIVRATNDQPEGK